MTEGLGRGDGAQRGSHTHELCPCAPPSSPREWPRGGHGHGHGHTRMWMCPLVLPACLRNICNGNQAVLPCVTAKKVTSDIGPHQTKEIVKSSKAIKTTTQIAANSSELSITLCLGMSSVPPGHFRSSLSRDLRKQTRWTPSVHRQTAGHSLRHSVVLLGLELNVAGLGFLLKQPILSTHVQTRP